MSARESVGRLKARTQSSSAPAAQSHVTVAVLPPHVIDQPSASTANSVGPAFGVSPAALGHGVGLDMMERRASAQSVSQNTRRKSFFRKGSLTGARQVNPDAPPFIFRTVTYETWRKHYAKDKDGNYKGTHAPAEDCLLKPDDLQRWRLGDVTSEASKWTRGAEALPVYSEVLEAGMVPEYQADDNPTPLNEPLTINQEEEELVSRLQRA